MALGPRLDLRQSQSLVMTPQLQQAIKLLALSNLEIESYIAEELEKNPLLDMADGARETRDDPQEGDGERASEPAGSDELLSGGGSENDSPLDMNSEADIFHHDCASDMADAGASDGAESRSSGLDGALGMNGDLGSGGIGGDDSGFENMLAGDISLQDHLHAQAGELLSGDAEFIARHLIGHIDDSGYMGGDMLEIAQALGAPLTEVESALSVIQSMEPIGVGARDLSECLKIQAIDADRYDPCMERMIANLDLVARGAWPQLKRMCQVDDEDLMDMIAELRSYDPKPGLKFGNAVVESVVPDLFVVPRGAGWAIELNNATLPRVLVNRQYYVEMSGGAHDKASKTWLNECLNEASWLVKALDQRQRTIIKVASEIVKQQEGFFRKGVSELKPLTLKNVAEAIEMHESTVSRVTSRKYLTCARGLFELKYFFTSGIQSSDGGGAVSAESVKAAIKTLIDNEDPKKILSDAKLVDLLKAQNFDIARRTVVKYRESMGLGSSVQRRRQKKLSGG